MPPTPLPDLAPADVMPRPPAAPAPAAAVHARVLSVVASRICRGAGPAEEEVNCLDLLCRAVLASPEAFKQALVRVRRLHGISDAEIVDSYIPAIACRLGSDWVDSRTSFVDVTIGTARLIAAAREISAGWRADHATDCRAPAMALIVPETEQHRLGAVIAASRFRRQGVSVRLLLGCRDDEIATVVGKGAFDLIGFSVATAFGLEACRRLIHMLRVATPDRAPIVVGGAVAMPAEEILALTGADHVVADPEEALRLCAMNVRRPRPLAGAGDGPRAGP